MPHGVFAWPRYCLLTDSTNKEKTDSSSSNSSPSGSDEEEETSDETSSSGGGNSFGSVANGDSDDFEDTASTEPVGAEFGSTSDGVGTRKPFHNRAGTTRSDVDGSDAGAQSRIILTKRSGRGIPESPASLRSEVSGAAGVGVSSVSERSAVETLLHVPRSTPRMPSSDDTVALLGGGRGECDKRPEDNCVGEECAGGGNVSSDELPEYAQGAVQPEPSQGNDAATAQEESQLGVSVPSHEDILRVVDEICHGVDTELVLIGDVERCVAERFGWEKIPKPMRNLVRRRLIEIINGVRDPYLGAGPGKNMEESKSMNDTSKREAQVAATPCDYDADEVRRQYALYRSAPALFPSHEQLRFVRLPEEWTPPALGTDTSGLRGGEGDRKSEGVEWNQEQHPPSSSLRYWPALVYNNIAELVRDLPVSETSMLKAKLFVEHRKRPSTVVARLVGWRDDTMEGGYPGDVSSPANYFPESRLEVLRLSSSSVTVCESNGELLPFYERQLDIEEAWMGELRGENDAIGLAAGGMLDSRDAAVNHAIKFLSALDVALNMLALDVGSDPLPPHTALIPEGGKDTPKAAGASAATSGVTPSGGRGGGIIRTLLTSHPGGPSGVEDVSYEGDQESEPAASDSISLEY